jgi:hypothetical protein
MCLVEVALRSSSKTEQTVSVYLPHCFFEEAIKNRLSWAGETAMSYFPMGLPPQYHRS